ncbi:MAG: hypothetical protein JW973_13100 [Bacteroidales bacterium]|nr:hypothetical protein [Bacteroidales bacterium]
MSAFLSSLYAQNIVSNSSFEDYVKCPYSTEYDTFPIIDWFVPNESTPDYYNVCAFNDRFSIPKNKWDSCPSIFGSAYIGIIPISPDGYMEHLTGKLTRPMVKGEKYKIGFFIKYTKAFVPLPKLLTIGLFLSNKPVLIHKYQRTNNPEYDKHFIEKYRSECSFNNLMELEIETHVHYKMTINSENWFNVSDIYIATGNEKFVTIGVFYNTSNKLKKMKYLNKINNYGHIIYRNKKESEILYKNSYQPYCFIDNVYVIKNDSQDNNNLINKQNIKETTLGTPAD